MEKPSYGGQAVIEGVVMRGPQFASLSVRDPSGGIVSYIMRTDSPAQKHKAFRLPIIRGAMAFLDSLSLGFTMLMKSADIAFPDEGKPSTLLANLSIALAAVIAIALFVVLPAVATPYVVKWLGIETRLLGSLVEVTLRLAVLAAYIALVSRMQEIQRVLMYHGAEHMTIWALEKRYREINERLYLEDWTLDDVAAYLAKAAEGESPLHPRCGTSFLFIVAMVLWVAFLFVSPESIIHKVAIRIALLPVVAGLSYEVLRLSASRDGAFFRLLRAPGMALQKMTTRMPDRDQLEVAADSLARLVDAERGGFAWKAK